MRYVSTHFMNVSTHPEPFHQLECVSTQTDMGRLMVLRPVVLGRPIKLLGRLILRDLTLNADGMRLK